MGKTELSAVIQTDEANFASVALVIVATLPGIFKR